MDAYQWELILAPGITPASDEALDYVQGPRDEHYEFAMNQILANWPTTTEPSRDLSSLSTQTVIEADLSVLDALKQSSNDPPEDWCPF